MSSHCNPNNCFDDCCNYYGDCPSDYSSYQDPKYSQCYSYNDDDDFPYWVLGPVIFGVYFIAICACICIAKIRRDRQLNGQMNQMEIVQHQNRNKQTIITNPNHNYPQPYPYNGGNQYDPGYDPNFQPQGGQPYLQHNPIQKNEPQGYFGAGFQQPQQQNGPILY